MFKKILKTIMLAQAASAARKTLRYLSDRDLDDMGLSRSTFVDGVVESVKADIEANVKDQPISKNIKCVVNPNLLVQYNPLIIRSRTMELVSSDLWSLMRLRLRS